MWLLSPPALAVEDGSSPLPRPGRLGARPPRWFFRTAAAEEAIRRIAAEVPEMLVGAGTVLTKEQADRAIAAGAQFIVSPGFNPWSPAYVLDKGAWS